LLFLGGDKMKKILIVGLSLLFILLLLLVFRPFHVDSGSNFAYNEKEEVLNMRETQAKYHNLTKEELVELKLKVKDGDAGAAMRIANYYGFALFDQKNEIIWLKKAASLGNKNAIEVLPSTLKTYNIDLEDIPEPVY